MEQIVRVCEMTSILTYLDGNTGSMLLQALLASFLTVGYVIKTRGRAIRQFVLRWGHRRR